VPFEVWLSAAVANDLERIFDYIADIDSHDSAVYVIENICEIIDNLSEFPDHGKHVSETEYLGTQAYRELSFKAYRVIYRVVDKTVRVFMVLDGRRDCRDLLRDRLLDR